MKNLVIRADAGGELGTGHVMRMIALAQAYMRRGGHVLLVSVQCPEPIINRVLDLGIEHHMIIGCELGDAQDSAATLQLCEENEAQWLVLDGYHFDEEYQQRVSGHVIKVLCVDDYGHCKTWNCDAVLNQNLGAEHWAPRKSKRSDTKWLLGSSFALIREEFFDSIRIAKEKKFPARRILVTMGGTDPHNVTLKVLCALEETSLEGLEMRVLVGGANPHQEKLAQFAYSSRYQIEVLCNVREMAPMYEWADAVISAGGSTCWEWLAYGLSGAVVKIAENQKPVVDELSKLGLAVVTGRETGGLPEVSSGALQLWLTGQIDLKNSNLRRGIIDAKGSDRLAAYLTGQTLKLRRASSDDLMTYFEWVNDSGVRNNSFCTTPIELSEHSSWFMESIASPSKMLFLAEDFAGDPVGQVRFDLLEEGDWLLDYSVGTEFRRQGLGPELLGEALVAYTHVVGNVNFRILAKVKRGNIGSIKVLKRVGFRSVLASSETSQPNLLELEYLSEVNSAR